MESKLVKPVGLRGKSPKSELSFLHEVIKAYEEGYRLPEMKDICVRDFPMFRSQFAVMMYKLGVEETTEEGTEVTDAAVTSDDTTSLTDPLDLVEDKSLTKPDLKALCEKEGVEYPDFPQVAKVRKHVKELLIAKRDSVPSEGNDNTTE
jgi:hypothetical protein